MALNYSLLLSRSSLLTPVATEGAFFSANTPGSQLFLSASLVEVERTEQVDTGPTPVALGVEGVRVCVVG